MKTSVKRRAKNCIRGAVLLACFIAVWYVASCFTQPLFIPAPNRFVGEQSSVQKNLNKLYGELKDVESKCESLVRSGNMADAAIFSTRREEILFEISQKEGYLREIEPMKNGNELATLYGIRIVPPRFGLSKDKYLLNTEEKVIAKGISSVKYMNADVANELYELAKAGKPESFMDLLMQLDEKTHLDTRQRDILVKIDYFAEYGNSKELLRMVNFFSFFKSGTMKKISKDKVTAELEPIIAQYATDKSKSGQPAKSYTFTDLPGLLRYLEVMVRDMHIQDFDLKSKMQIQLENLGYIDLTTNKKEDQRKLVILDIYPLRSKKTKEVWAYALQVRSIGTGKTNRWTIYSELYDRKPLQRYDTIYVPMNGWGERRGYLYLYNYDYVI